MFKSLFTKKRPAEEEELVEAVTMFFRAETWNEAKKIALEKRSLVLMERADDVLRLLGEMMIRKGDDHLLPMVGERRELLAKFRVQGIERTFSDLPKRTLWEISKVCRSLLSQPSAELVNANKTLLLDPRTDDFLGHLLSVAQKRNDKEFAQRVLDCMALIQASDGKEGNSKEDNIFSVQFMEGTRAVRQVLRTEDSGLRDAISQRSPILASPEARTYMSYFVTREYQKPADQQDDRSLAIIELIIRSQTGGSTEEYERYRARRALRELWNCTDTVGLKNVLDSESEYLHSQHAKARLKELLAATDVGSPAYNYLLMLERIVNGDSSVVDQLFLDSRKLGKQKLRQLLDVPIKTIS